MNVICIGEIVWDQYKDIRLLGGAPFNLSANLKKLGHQVMFFSGVGNDIFGDEALNIVTKLGLDTQFINKIEGYNTGTVIINANSNGADKFTINLPASFEHIFLDKKQFKTLLQITTPLLCFGTLCNKSTSVRALMRSIIKAMPQVKCFYDMNLRKNLFSKKIIVELLEYTSILKLNYREGLTCKILFKKEKWGIDEFCKFLISKFELEYIFLTRGKDGCTVYTSEIIKKYPTFKSKLIDSVGAGDAFSAGIVHGILSNWEIDKIAMFANKQGAEAITRKGAISF